MNKSITVHTLVQNEEKYLWFSVMSVIDFVDRVLIWDTGSSDNTLEIIKFLDKTNPGKIVFKEVGNVSPDNYSLVRQQMLDETKTDWMVLVDGDEVWWEDTINEVVSIINEKGDLLDSIVSRYTNLIGDIYHHQNDNVGQYRINGSKGYLTIRAMNRNIKGLKAGRPHGQQGFFDETGTLIQERDENKRILIDRAAYLHFTNLPRSSSSNDSKVPKRKMKYKYELGNSFPLDFYYPEVLFRSKPDIIESPWVKRDNTYILRAAFETPLKEFKRKYFINRKSGY